MLECLATAIIFTIAMLLVGMWLSDDSKGKKDLENQVRRLESVVAKKDAEILMHRQLLDSKQQQIELQERIILRLKEQYGQR